MYNLSDLSTGVFDPDTPYYGTQSNYSSFSPYDCGRPPICFSFLKSCQKKKAEFKDCLRKGMQQQMQQVKNATQQAAAPSLVPKPDVSQLPPVDEAAKAGAEQPQAGMGMGKLLLIVVSILAVIAVGFFLYKKFSTKRQPA